MMAQKENNTGCVYGTASYRDVSAVYKLLIPIVLTSIVVAYAAFVDVGLVALVPVAAAAAAAAVAADVVADIVLLLVLMLCVCVCVRVMIDR